MTFRQFLEAYGDGEYGPIAAMTASSPNLRINSSELMSKGIRSKFVADDGSAPYGGDKKPKDPRKMFGFKKYPFQKNK